MLGNLMPPLVENRLDRVAETPIVRSIEIIDHTDEQLGCYMRVHPRYRAWFSRCGIKSARDVFALSGEVVSGHPDRHVLRVEITSGSSKRIVYIKREHRSRKRIRYKNWRAGFGWVSRAEREAELLQHLEDARLPGPQWIAYGKDAQNRTFLMVEELTGSRELRVALADRQLAAQERRLLFHELGNTLAQIHDAGYTTPDLSAKHVFVRNATQTVAFLDWPSSRFYESVPKLERVRFLARLSASLSDALISPRERLRVLRAYLRRLDPTSTRSVTKPLRSWMQQIHLESQRIRERRSLKEQRHSGSFTQEQRLVWLAEEQVVVVPSMVRNWPRPAVCSPFYLHARENVQDGLPIPLTLANGDSCTLIRYRTPRFWGQLWNRILSHDWQSPGQVMARLLFQLQRYQIDAPELLAFGQREPHGSRTDSFVLYRLPAGSPGLSAMLMHEKRTLVEQRRMLRQLGSILRRCHDAGYPVADIHNFLCVGDAYRIMLDPSSQIAPSTRLNSRQMQALLAQLLRTLPRELTRTDCMRVIRGYSNPNDHKADRKKMLAAILRRVES